MGPCGWVSSARPQRWTSKNQRWPIIPEMDQYTPLVYALHPTAMYSTGLGLGECPRLGSPHLQVISVNFHFSDANREERVAMCRPPSQKIYLVQVVSYNTPIMSQNLRKP